MNEYRKVIDFFEKRVICNNYLMRNKFLLCVIVNGMGFLMKLEFFYFNELECRLLVLRIVF